MSLFDAGEFTVPRHVATTLTTGGRCHHCHQQIEPGRDIFKFSPHCCNTHGPQDTAGGPGSWVCSRCWDLLR
jgi:hypothetical protein